MIINYTKKVSLFVVEFYEKTMHNLERLAREPGISKRMKVPADETYKEWHQRMVEKHGAEAINTAEKSAKNYSSDKKQYKEYVNFRKYKCISIIIRIPNI